MAINKKLIHFKNYSDFIGSSGINGTTMPTNGYYHNIPETSIVFILDTKLIWTHGQLYSCPFTEEEINQLLVGSNIKLDGYSEIDSPIDILATDTVNLAIGKLEDYINSMSELNAILVDTEDVADDPAVNDYITSTQLENKLLNKQNKLVSGTNIKTINGESILGSGDIVISGGEPSNARKEIIYEGGRSDYTITSMRPNVVYWLDDIQNITIDSFEEPLQDSDSYDIFTAVISLGHLGGGTETVSLTLPDDVFWANGQMPDLTRGRFELSISRISDGYDSHYFAVLTPFDRVE